MSITKTKTLTQADTKLSAGVLSGFVMAAILPFFLHLQLVTGPLINAMLILAAVILGLRWAIILSIFPSIMAMAGGLLLPVMLPVVPYIIMSNMIMVALVDYYFKSDKNANNGYWKGVLSGALAKSFFLMMASASVLTFMNNPQAIKLAVSAFGIVQFLTALAGACIAFVFLKYIKKI
jgi:hypothetical protein